MGSRWVCFCELPVDSLLWREQSCPVSLSPALLFSQHLSRTRKAEPARAMGVCSPLARAFKPEKNHTEPKWKQEGPDFSGTIEGRGDGPYTSFQGPWRLGDLACLHTGGPLTTAMVSLSWLRECVTPGGGLGTLWASLHLPGSGSCVWGDHIPTKLRQREEYMRGSLVFRNSCFTVCTLYRPVPLYPRQVHSPWGSWRLLRCLYLVVNPIHQQEHCWKGGRFTWWIDCRAQRSGKKPKGKRWHCCCDFLPVDHSYSAETRPGPCLPALNLACFLNTSVEQERTEPARTKVVCSTLSWQL